MRTSLPAIALVGTLASSVTMAQTAATEPVIPVIGEAMRARLAAILASPAGASNYRNSFAKVGDSITESGSFLKDIGCQIPPDPTTYGAYASLIPTVDWFRARTFSASYSDAWCGVSNAFTVASRAAEGGTTSAYAFATTTACPSPYNSVLRCEYYRMRPSFALVMFGTNDVLVDVDLPITDAVARYRANLQGIVDRSIEAGVVPVLSTIPPLVRGTWVSQTMVDRVANYNQVVVDVASANNVPLWNYHRAMVALGSANNYGISSDGIHPSIYNLSDGANFSTNALRYGYNVRNLTALQVLEALKAALVDAASAPVLATTSLPTGVVDTFYQVTIDAAGSPRPTFTASPLPPGLTINAATGVISGYPSVAGVYSVGIGAKNGIAPDALSVLTMTIQERVAPVLATVNPPVAYTSLSYRYAVSASGTPAPTYAASGLPPGLRIDSYTGIISGVPTTVGNYNGTITASNGAPPDALIACSMTVAPGVAPALTSGTPPSPRLGVPYTFTVTATGAPAPTFSASGLPTGLRINGTTGVISGTPTRAATYTATIYAQNGLSPRAARRYTLTVTR